jgi:Antibiotic biosynthesis monooxygenase
MEQIQINAVFPRVEPACRAEFEELAGQLVRITREEPGSVHYDWFIDDDGRCVLRETWSNSAAVVAHLPLVEGVLARLVDIGGGFEAEVFGHPSPELRAVIPDHVKIYRYLMGTHT